MAAHKTHGQGGTKLHGVWVAMLHRCRPEYKQAQYYYNKGITVCEEWENFTTFMRWAKDAGYREGLQIDRIDNAKGYYPENCRWVTPKEQTRNRGTTIRIEIEGEMRTLGEWAEIFGISYTALWKRAKRKGLL